MQANKPLDISDLIPFGLTIDDVLVLAISLGIFMMIWSIGNYLIERDRFTPRLKMIAERRAELKGEMLAAKRRKKAPKVTHLTIIRQIVQQLKLLQENQVGVLQQKLNIAGYRSKDAVTIFVFAKAVMPFIGIGWGLAVSKIDWSHPTALSQSGHWTMLLGITVLCIRMPEIVVRNGRNKRQHSMRRALPDALDLMMICAEAGLSLAASLDRVARELARLSPILAEEFSLTSVELGFLPDRALALRHLAERTELPEIRGFVNVIAQTEKYGTPIAQALRVLAREFRTERMLRAEQKAARLPAMMTVPMIVFILPTLFIIVLAPAIIQVMNTI